jgi:hypothetical protein
VSVETQHNANVLFQLSANLAETCIFLELGLSVFGLPGSSFNWSFIAWAFLGSLLGRALGIYPLVLVHNYCLTERSWPVEELPNAAGGGDGDLRKLDGEVLATLQRSLSMDSLSHIRTPAKRQDKHISTSLAHMIWFAGLRGAVAYACVRKFPNVSSHVDELTAATMSIVLVSIIFMGGTTSHLLQALGIATNVDEDAYMNEWRKQRALKGRFHELGTCPLANHTQHTHKLISLCSLFQKTSTYSPTWSVKTIPRPTLLLTTIRQIVLRKTDYPFRTGPLQRRRRFLWIVQPPTSTVTTNASWRRRVTTIGVRIRCPCPTTRRSLFSGWIEKHAAVSPNSIARRRSTNLDNRPSKQRRLA